MKIGVSTSCYYPLETEKSLIEIGKAGIKDTEIFFNALCELEKPFCDELFAIKEYYGINVLSLHPTMSLAESFMLYSAYKRRYDEAIEWYKRYAEIAASFGAKYIIMHGGKPNRVLNDEEYIERFSEISRVVESHGAYLLQENVVKFRAGSLDFIKKFVSIYKGNGGLCLDIKQSIRGGYTPFDVIQTAGEKIKHVHISDSTDKADCLLPFNGDFDFAGFFNSLSAAGYKGDAVIEVYSDSYRDYSEIKESYNKITGIF